MLTSLLSCTHIHHHRFLQLYLRISNLLYSVFHLLLSSWIDYETIYLLNYIIKSADDRLRYCSYIAS